MLSSVTSAAVLGIDAYTVNVEVDIAAGLPTFATVGLPDAAVKESKDRVVAAIRNSGFDFPVRKITVNLAPADVKKEGAAFDLPIAVGILATQEEIPAGAAAGIVFVGELALDGSLRPVRGVLSVALHARDAGAAKVILPAQNAREAAVIKGITVLPADNLLQVVRYLNGEGDITPAVPVAYRPAGEELFELDFSEVKGQGFAKRALEIAAAGGHNVIMIGPPGAGKTMLARRLPGILPPLTLQEAVETTKIHSVAGMLSPDAGLTAVRPFRAPHHTISAIALIGGGSTPRPGEVSLAHNGVLFLDELTELHRDVLEVLRQPLEDRMVTVSRAKHSLSFPSAFMLVGAMNPCPCGHYGHPEKECLCTPFQIQKYRAKISGPLLDRVDIHLEIPALKAEEMADDMAVSEPSASIRRRVTAARQLQRERFAGCRTHANAQMSSRQIKKYCGLDEEGKKLLRAAIERLRFSARAYDRILKVSRTIADLDGKSTIEEAHIAEAIQYRNLDRYL